MFNANFNSIYFQLYHGVELLFYVCIYDMIINIF
jgi:hypothetical protein